MSAVLQAREPSAKYLVAEAPSLVRQFDLLATAPGGVARLRELILTLAVQGKLVPQQANEATAARQLQEIAEAKSLEPAAQKRGRRTETAGELLEPFPLPGAWTWSRLGDVTDISGGVTLGRKGAIAQPLTLPYLRVANVQRWRVQHDDLKSVTIATAELARFQLCEGDLLITEGGDWDKVGRTAIWRGEVPLCLHQNHVFKARGLTPTWNPAWAELYLNSPVARAYFAGSAKQTTNLASINMTQLKACPFPLPPLAEQARIVARVDELMRLCDALEANGRLGAAQHQQLLTTLLGTLTDSRAPEELAVNWQRVADHFDVLLDRPEAVDDLERTVINLAVRGLLVLYDPKAATGQELLQSIEAAFVKTALAGSRTIEHEPSAIDPLWKLPINWAWGRFSQVAAIASNLVSPKYFPEAWQIGPDCIEKGTGKLLSRRTVADAGVISSNHRFTAGQLLYSKIRPSLSKVVRVDFDGLCSADMYPIDTRIQSDYLLLGGFKSEVQHPVNGLRKRACESWPRSARTPPGGYASCG